MASVLTNGDINVLANITLESLKIGLQPLTTWSTGFRSGARLNDSAKVFVNGMTLDASDFNKSSNNYETVDADTTTGVDITLDTKIKKTAEIAEEDFAKIDISAKLADIGYAVANEAVLRTYNKLTAANYATENIIGAASGFTYDDVVDLEVLADDAGFANGRSLLLANTYTANLKKDGLLVANKNQPSDPSLVWQRFDAIANFQTMSSSLLKTSTPAVGAENLVGFITDSSAMGIAMGTPEYNGGGDVEVATVQDESGIGLQLRRHYSRATGSIYLNAVMLFGTEVTRATGLQRLVSA
jgi:hypothetical protein